MNVLKLISGITGWAADHWVVFPSLLGTAYAIVKRYSKLALYLAWSAVAILVILYRDSIVSITRENLICTVLLMGIAIPPLVYVLFVSFRRMIAWIRFLFQPSTIRDLPISFGHVARVGDRLWDFDLWTEISKVWVQNNPGTPIDMTQIEIMRDWWFTSIKPMLEDAAGSISSRRWEYAFVVLDRINCRIHEKWGVCLQATSGTPPTKKWLGVYSETIAEIDIKARRLISAGWSIKWTTYDRLGGN